jgi:molecular chaperone GrpE
MRESSDTDSLLSRFQQWLDEVRAEADSEGPSSGPAGLGPEDREVGLYRLVEEFTALRQELKLQTKSARGLQEQTEAVLPALREAIEQLRKAEPGGARTAGDPRKSPAEALADLDEALERGREGIEKARTRLVEEPETALAAALDAHLAGQSWLRRRWNRKYHAEVRAVALGVGPEQRRAFFEALLEGYDLIRSRLRRALQAEGIERIECLGRPVDPERMVVLAVVEDPSRPPGEVIEEVRRGYTWRQRVLRPAEVRASRAPLPSWDLPGKPEAESEAEPEPAPR